MEDSVHPKGRQRGLSVKKGKDLKRRVSFNNLNHCGKQGREFVSVPELRSGRDYIIHIGPFGAESSFSGADAAFWG